MKTLKAFGLAAMLLAFALIFAGCDVAMPGDNVTPNVTQPTTYAPLTIYGTDSQNRVVEIEFSTTRLVSASVTAAKAAAKAASAPVMTPESGDSYKIKLESKVVSSGTIKRTGTTIEFTSTTGDKFSGTYKGGNDLTIPEIPLADGESIKQFEHATGETVVAKPTAKPGKEGDTVPVAEGDSVTLSTTTSGAKIYYTTDGDDPGSSSTEYKTPIKINWDTTIKAIAIKSGMTNSPVATYAYKVDLNQVAMPTAAKSPNAANNKTTVGTEIFLGCSTSGAIIKYTTDGTNPSGSSTTYTDTEKIEVQYPNGEPFTVKAIAIKTGMNSSAMFDTTYSNPVAKPTASPDSGKI